MSPLTAGLKIFDTPSMNELQSAPFEKRFTKLFCHGLILEFRT